MLQLAQDNAYVGDSAEEYSLSFVRNAMSKNHQNLNN